MAFPSPSIGDILMMSQIAWKIGCAFTAGRSGAPAEFKEVESELRGLTSAITMLAETLDEDDSVLARSDRGTQEGLVTIIRCCSQSLHDLEAFVEQYQDIKRTNENGLIAVQSGWKKVLVKNWKTIAWTTEGGALQSLRNMLAMHTQSIQLAMQALQTRSLSRLEIVIEPMAIKLDEVHGKLNGDIDLKIAEIHHVMLSLQAAAQMSPTQSPNIWANSPDESKFRYDSQDENAIPPPLQTRNSLRTRSSVYSRQSSSVYSRQSGSVYSRQSSQHGGDIPSPARTPDLSDSEYTAHSPPKLCMSGSSQESHSQRNSVNNMDMFYSFDPNPPHYDKKYRNASEPSQASRFSPKSLPQDIRNQLSVLSMALPPPAIDPTEGTRHGSSVSDTMNAAMSAIDTGIYPRTRSGNQSGSSMMSSRSHPRRYSGRPVTPSVALEMVVDRDEEDFEVGRLSSVTDSVTIANFAKPKPSDDNEDQIASVEDQATWERNLLTHSAVLCEISANSVDYTIPDEETPGDWIMKNACSDCKIYLITRGHQLPSGKSQWVTSVWAVSNNRATRLQQKLPEEDPLIPYTVWGSPTKVVIRVQSELRYHDTSPDDTAIATAQSSWVTYAFPDENTATKFQNVLMDKTVLLSVKTKRTMRVHEGIGGAFTFAEQLCGLENLRIVAEPTTGVVSAMLHYSPAFAEGYMIFSLNTLNEPIRVKEESETVVRIKGLKVPVGIVAEKKMSRRPSNPNTDKEKDGTKKREKAEKVVAGAKIEFSSVKDKVLFVEKLRAVQAAAMVI